MFKKILVLFFYLFAGFSAMAKEKSLSYFMKKYDLPDNVNIMSVFSNDCINCYYGFSMFLKSHEIDFKKKDFVFLFKKDAEVDNIFKYQLGLDKTNCLIIVDDEFYKVLDKQTVSTLTIIEDKKIREQFISKDIYKFKTFAGSTIEAANLKIIDTLDLKGRFGTKKFSVDVLNESKIVVHNKYSNDVTLFDLTHKKAVKSISLAFFTEKYDSLLTLLLSDKPEELTYNLNNYKTTDYYKTFPLCGIKKVSCVGNIIYIGLTVSRMVKDTNNHVNHEASQVLVKLDSNLNMLHVYKLRKSLPDVPTKYISLGGYSFINADTAVFSLSCAGDRKKDSVAVLYDLNTNDTKVIELSYDSFMPLKGESGYYNYYHFSAWKDHANIIKANFTRSPYIFNVAAKTKELLPGLDLDMKTFDLQGKDKYFWISKIFPYRDKILMIATLKQNEMFLVQYDNDLKTLISKKKIFDGYLTDIFILKDLVFAFEDYSEKGDVATLHRYRLK